MAVFSDRLRRILDRHRRRFGSKVTFGGRVYRVVTEETSGQKAGTGALPTEVLGVYAASADPRTFHFSPGDFAPWTAVEPPQEGDLLTWHGLLYLATHVTYEDVDDDTTALIVYAYRKIV